MQSIKSPAVSGQFYPSDSDELRAMINQCVKQGHQSTVSPKAIIAPHAGYIYSGPIAGSAYSILPGLKKIIKNVIILGPCHRVPVRKFAVSSYDAFQTPLGTLPVHRTITNQLVLNKQAEINDPAFEHEHSIEVHLPFLQELLADITIVPILVGSPSVNETSQLLNSLYDDDSTLIIVSSDLSHYLNYESACALDLKTSQAISSLRINELSTEQACGRFPVKGLMQLAIERDLTARTIDLRNSGDTQGYKTRVVGYGAYHFYKANEAQGLYTSQQKNLLKELAKRSILNGIEHGQMPSPNYDNLPFAHSIHKATFITLTQQGQLRGCIGSLEAHQPLVIDILQNAFKAAFADPRFSKLTQDELSSTQLSISILSEPQEMKIDSEVEFIQSLRPGIDGLIIEDIGKRAIFLPSVWESIHEPSQFVIQLKLKAGMNADHWSDEFKAYRFIADKF